MDASKLMFKDGLMAGERILVTGGGSGLGKEMTEAFVKLGADVYICGRRGDVLSETAQEIMGRHGGNVWPIPCDIRNAEAIHEMVDQIWATGGALTGLMNNAAGNFISRTEDLSPRGFDAIAMDSREEEGKRVLHPDDMGLEWRSVHGAVSHVEGRSQCDDAIVGGGVGALRHSLQRDCARAFPN